MDRPEDPAVAVVEEILAAAAGSAGDVPTPDAKLVVEHAVWLCACVTDKDAPAWLIYDTSDGRLGWCRVPDGVEPSAMVETPLVVGDHVDPVQVLDWLKGTTADPRSDHDSPERAVFAGLARKIRDLQAG